MKSTLFHSFNKEWIFGIFLFTLTFLAYYPAWNGQPVWDDALHITSPELRSINGLTQIWTHPRGTVQYFPLVHTVFWIEAKLFGDSTTSYHLLNILLHFISALLLVSILRKLGIPGAWFAAGIFALHPVMVESVAWISELKNTLSGVFFLSTVLAYVTYTETGRRRTYILSLVLFILGLLSKTTIAPFPLAMLAIVWWKCGGLLWKRDILPTLPFFITGILFGIVTLYVERTHIGTRGPEYDFSLIERCLIAGRALWFYLGKVFLPVNLMICYPRWVLSAVVWWQYLFPAAALAAGCILWTMRKTWRAPAAVFFYFVAMLLPCLGFISFYTFRYSFVADHQQYLAAIGPIVIGASLLNKAVGLAGGSGRFLKPVLDVMLLLTLGMLSWNQSGMYTDAETLYRTTITRNDNCSMAHNNLGRLLADKGRTDEAMVHYQKALKLDPNHAETYNNFGTLLKKMGRTDEAMAYYQKALEFDPNYALTHSNLGNLFTKTGQIDNAIFHFHKALEISPNSAEIQCNFGILLENIGRTEEARVHYQKALELNPYYSDAHSNLGALLTNLGRFDEARAHFQKAVELNPNSADAHYNLCILLAKMGRTYEARAHYQRALELNPNLARKP